MTKVRLVHDLGGPEQVAPIERRGSNVFVTLGSPATVYPVDLSTGYLKSLPKHKIRWRIHPDDFKAWRQEPAKRKGRF